MIRFTATATIRRPVEDVFAFMTTVQNAPRWAPWIIEAQQTSQGPLGTGTTYRQVIELLGQRGELALEVTQYEPNKVFGARSTSGPLQASVVNAFEAVAEGTRITLTTEGEMTGFYKMVEPLIAELLERQAEEALVNLKAILEAA